MGNSNRNTPQNGENMGNLGLNMGNSGGKNDIKNFTMGFNLFL